MNRRLFLTGAALLSVGSLTACTSSETAMPAPADLSATPIPPPTTILGRHVLLAYFSRPGENYSYGGRTTLNVGNTQIVADMIAAATTVGSAPAGSGSWLPAGMTTCSARVPGPWKPPM